MTALVVQRPGGLPPGMVTGLAAGLGAGAFWGSAFIAPVIVPEFGSVDVTVGRFLACGLLSLLLLLWGALRGEARWPTAPQARAALGLSVLGYTGYYLLLVLAIAEAGPALPVLVIGTIPLWLMLLGKPEHLRWRMLMPGLLLTATGVGVMFALGARDVDTVQGASLWRGLAWALCAAASWTAFGLLNARWLARHPQIGSTAWSNWLGVAAGLGACLLWAGWGTPWAELVVRPGFAVFVGVCVFTGIGSGWVAAVLWNMASRRLSPSLAGQLIVSETVFGLVYAFAWDGSWPLPLQWLACLLFVLGIVSSIRAHR